RLFRQPRLVRHHAAPLVNTMKPASGNLILLLVCFCCSCSEIAACKSSPEALKPRYIGCYQDKEGSPDLERLAGGDGLGTGRVNRKLCDFLCRGSGNRYFGLQGGGSCFCGDSYGRYGSVDESSCDQNCRGYAEEICGGEGVNSVYEIVLK
ncbi:hypothetical protein BOX15_Mlig028245g1, partial [Macrostomum lignano]